MKTRRLVAITLAVAVALCNVCVFTCGQGSFITSAYAAETQTVDVTTPSPQDTDQVESDQEGEQDGGETDPSNPPSDDQDSQGESSDKDAKVTSNPVSVTGEVKETEEPTSELTEVADTEEPTSEPTEVADTEEPTSEPTEVADTEEPTSEPTQEATDAPAADVGFLYVSASEAIYTSASRTTILGTMNEGDVVYAEVSEAFENGTLYKAYFDTTRTTDAENSESGYFYASSTTWLVDGDEALATMVSVRTAGDVSIPSVDFVYADEKQEEIDDDKIYGKATSNVKFRQEPTIDSSVICELNKGTTVVVIGSVQNEKGETWYSVQSADKTGYIRADLVAVDGDVPALGGDVDPADETAEPTEPADETEEPAEATETPEAEPSEEPEATETPVPAYTITVLAGDATTLVSYTMEEGTILDAASFDAFIMLDPEQTFKGWYLCDASGNVEGAVTFGEAVTQSITMIAVAEEPVATEEPLPSEEPVVEVVERSVHVALHADTEELTIGSSVTLAATLNGYEEVQYDFVWQTAAIDELGNIIGDWQNTEIDTLEFSYTLAEDNLMAAWRMCVTITE
ncbi:MAG: SH3 domain-containing protein [Clostridiales bacterium]|nr:SH3 domain-containing protein [Clostridiales bacterium]